VCPGRFTATYLLLLAIQRGAEAQAAAVDWILARDWPQGAAGAEGAAGGRGDAPGGSPQPGRAPTPAEAGEDSSVDTAQLLGREAADALSLADTASSRVKQAARYQAAMAGDAGVQQPGDAAAAAAVNMQERVEQVLRNLASLAATGPVGMPVDAGNAGFLRELRAITGLPESFLNVYVHELRAAAYMVRDWAGQPGWGPPCDCAVPPPCGVHELDTCSAHHDSGHCGDMHSSAACQVFFACVPQRINLCM
jgi:hypothetical protein